MGSMSTTIETDLLERGPFLVELEQRLEESRVAGRLVLLGGEAGVGKTALLRRFCLLHRETARAFWGACDPLFTPRPLRPLLRIAARSRGGGAAGRPPGGEGRPGRTAWTPTISTARPAATRSTSRRC